MKTTGLFWPVTASVALHATLIAAVSWLQSPAATAPRAHAYVEVAFYESEPATHPLDGEGERSREAQPTKSASVPGTKTKREGAVEDDADGVTPSDLSSESFAKEEPPREIDPPSANEENPRPDTEPAHPAELNTAAENLSAQTDHLALAVDGSSVHPGGSPGVTPSASFSTSPASSASARHEVTTPSILRMVEPTYPRAARRAGHQGRVLIDAEILSSGRVGNATVLESSGYANLDEAALKAAEKSRFNPASREGIPIESSKQLVFRFVLEEN